jgi:hypothetical protein
LTIIMTPEKKPFFAATYIPKESRFGRVGLLKLIPGIRKLWETRRGDLEEAAQQAVSYLKAFTGGAEGEVTGEGALRAGFDQLARVFDAEYGGFGGAPKFTTPHNLTFLLRYWKRFGDATFDPGCLKKAVDLNGLALRRFWDDSGGGFYFTADDGEDILVRRKEVHDGAVPSGNSVAMLNLLRLGRMTAAPELESKAWRLSRAFAAGVAEAPAAHTRFLAAVDLGVGPSFEVVIAGNPLARDFEVMLQKLRSGFIPNKAVIVRPEGEAPEIVALAGFTRDLRGREGKATAYVCRNYECKLPTTDAGEMLAFLDA